MLQSCTVTGSFVCQGRPVAGLVRFVPERLWLVQDGTCWATLAPTVRLSSDGSFVAEVTATDYGGWHYLVQTPAGSFRVMVPWHPTGHSLKELIGEHHPGPRP